MEKFSTKLVKIKKSKGKKSFRQISVRISAENIMAINRLAKETGLSRNKVIMQCIDYAMEHIAKPE